MDSKLGLLVALIPAIEEIKKEMLTKQDMADINNRIQNNNDKSNTLEITVTEQQQKP